MRNRNGKVTAEEFLEQIKRLQNEFFIADVQFELFVGLFGASHFPNSKSTNYPAHDYQFVLDAVRARRQKLFGD